MKRLIDPEDVQREADGTWRIKAGARVRVRVTMAAPSRRYHVALVDYLPAGFESLNPELAVTEAIPEDKKQEADSTYSAVHMASVGGCGAGFGSTIRTCETNVPRLSRRCCGVAFTTTVTSLAQRRPDYSLSRRQRPKRCITRRLLAAVKVIASGSSD